MDQSIVKAALRAARAYHRLRVFGVENIPPAGHGFLLAPNHTHWLGWDALMINAALPGRLARWVAWSYDEEFPLWAKMVHALNCIPASQDSPFPYEYVVNELDDGGIVGIFPEGNNSTLAAPYRLRPFFPGVVRMAVMAGVPIVPVSVAGIAEAGPVIWAKEEEGSPPVFVVPAPILLPLRVTVRFGEPVFINLDSDDLQNRSVLDIEAERIRERVLALLQNDRPRASKQKI